MIAEIQGKVSSQPSKNESKQNKGDVENVTNTKSKLTEDLIVREVRLFKEKLGYMKTVSFAAYCKASLS